MWRVGFISEAARLEVRALPPGLGKRFKRLVRLIEETGLQALHEPHAKQVEGKLWELRVFAREGIARSFYVLASEQQVVVLRTFVKKSQKLPRREIEIALARLEGMN